MPKTISTLPDKRTIVNLTASSPPPASAGTVLKDAIRLADGKRLRLVLQKHNAVFRLSSRRKFLFAPEARVGCRISERDNDSDISEDSEDGEDEDGNGDGDKGEEDGDTDERRTEVTPNLKRLRPRFGICDNCNEEFDVETNDKYSCMWHPGRLPLHSSRWLAALSAEA